MRTEFITTGSQKLNYQLPPMRLWQKAKKYGIWNPADLDFTQDAQDWKQLSDLEKDVVLRLTTLFQAGEEAVTLDLLPLIMVIAKEGRIEEEMFLTSFLWEEAKHVEGFNRFFTQVCPDAGDLSRYYTPSYLTIFGQELPNVMDNLLHDPSPVAQARASVTYNMIVEGVLAETGYHAYYAVLKNYAIFPGMLDFVGKLKQDESRHIAYGIYLLSRLTAQYGPPVWDAIETRMNELIEPAIAFIMESLGCYEQLPFGLEIDMFLDYAMDQFQKRMERIERARTQTMEEVCSIALADV
ncbi:MAG TPA: R2-like ligand-binding oxidase [Chitinophagales bacterium]|nr:R2-like ligand-binding oxidase [Chitinophagales bacterium]